MTGSEDIDYREYFGCAVAVATPFTHTRDICYDSLGSHLEFLLENGIQKILVAGTTGEFFSLTPAERTDLYRFCVNNFSGGVYCNTGTGPIQETKFLIREAEKAGASGVFSLPPCYPSGISGDILTRYFREISQSSGIPMYIYNFPEHTGNPLTPEIINASGCIGVKDSSKSLDMINQLSCTYIAGGDSVILESKRRGGGGFISARANLFPDIFAQVQNILYISDYNPLSDGDRGLRVQKRIDAIASSISSNDQISVIKYLITKRIPGYNYYTRLPLRDLSPKEEEEADEIYYSIFDTLGDK